METEELNTKITEEVSTAPKKSLKPWLIGLGVFAAVAFAMSISLALRTPPKVPGHQPTAEELEQLKFDADQQERDQKKADLLRDQNLLMRDDDSQLRLKNLMKDFGDDSLDQYDEEDYPEAEEYDDEDEAIDHILRQTPPAVVPSDNSPQDGNANTPMFIYSRAFGGAKYVDTPKTAVTQPRNAEAVEKSPSVNPVIETAATPQTEKKTPVIYTGLPLVTLYEGEMLEAVLVNRIIADTEASPVICHLSRDLFDRSGRYVVLPANSRVIGSSQVVSYKGAHRLFITFHRIILPGGPSIELPSSQKAMKALDGTGALGVVSKVDRHWFLQFGTSVFFGVLDGLSAAAQRNQEDSVRSAVVGRTSENFDRVLENIMSQYSSIVPTIRVDQGKTLKIYLADDIVITPYARISDRSYYATR